MGLDNYKVDFAQQKMVTFGHSLWHNNFVLETKSENCEVTLDEKLFIHNEDVS